MQDVSSMGYVVCGKNGIDISSVYNPMNDDAPKEKKNPMNDISINKNKYAKEILYIII